MKRLAILALVVIACGGGWDKGPGQTTCNDWINSMSNDQRQDMAYGMLLGIWRSENAVSEPSIDLAKSLANRVGGICPGIPASIISSVAADIYTLDGTFHPS